MKIIRHGKLPPVVTRRFECGKCHCIFECTADEHKIMLDRYEGHLHSVCPECGGRAFETVLLEEGVSND